MSAVIALRNERFGLSLSRAAGLGIASVYLFVLPAAALHYASGVVSETSGVGLFCTIPVMTILDVSSFGEESGTSRGLLLPAVVALGGAFLLFPIQMPGSMREWIFFALVVACCAIVAGSNVWIHGLLKNGGSAAAVAVVGFSGALALGGYGLVLGWPALSGPLMAGELLRCAVFDLPAVWLTVWLMREVTPVRLSVRFLLVPLMTLLEGYAALGVRPAAKTLLELAAVLAGAAVLLIRNEPEEIPGLHLR